MGTLRMARARLKGDTVMTESDYMLRAIDAAFRAGKGEPDAFDRAFERGVKQEIASADVQHLVTGLAETRGRSVRARCGQWVPETHNVGGPVTCVHCNRLNAEDEAEEASMQRLLLGERA
jgi:hypothetical protein